MTIQREPSNNFRFELEELEQRMMLSTVSINATGHEGSELLNVYVGENLVIEETVPTSGDVFEYSSDEFFLPSDVRIEFINDLYQPEQGFDRNITINDFSVHNVSLDFNSSDMFSSGTWLSGDGVATGFGRGNTLHANGYFQFVGSIDNTVVFQDAVWAIDGPASSVSLNDGDLVLDPASGPVSVSRQVDIEGGTPYKLNVGAYRDVQAFFDRAGQPWATVGINFYAESGAYISQRTIDVTGNNTNPGTVQELDFTSPEGATTAFVWAWIGRGPNIPLVLEDIQLEQIDLTGDTTPVTVELQPFTLTEPTGAELNFGVDFSDDQRLGTEIAEPFRVTGPNGFSELAGVRTGFGTTDTFETQIYGLLKPDGTDWAPSDNGTYTIELLDNAVFDAAGNVTPGGVLGQFEIAIVLPPADTEAPGISIQPIADLTAPRNGPIEFAVYTTDNRDPIPFANNITVGNLGGFTRITGIAGGYDAENDRNWELYQIRPPIGDSWGPEDNGTYLISLQSGGLVDAAGNETPRQLLGSFTVNIPVGVA